MLFVFLIKKKNIQLKINALLFIGSIYKQGIIQVE